MVVLRAGSMARPGIGRGPEAAGGRGVVVSDSVCQRACADAWATIAHDASATTITCSAHVGRHVISAPRCSPGPVLTATTPAAPKPAYAAFARRWQRHFAAKQGAPRTSL